MANKHETLGALFTATADAIRAKTGDASPIIADDFPDAIGAITGGGGGGGIEGSGPRLVRFIDYDGTILKAVRCENGASVSPPSAPVHTGLTFQEWNHAGYGNVTSDLDIGATYITSDGKTRLYITVTPVTGLTTTVCVTKTDTSTLKIEWGDGSSSNVSTSGASTTTHTYAAAGNYVIALSITSGTGQYSLGGGANTTTVIGGAQADQRNSLTRAEVGADVAGLNQYAFSTCRSLQHVTLPSGATNIGISAFHNCSSIRAVIVPRNVSGIANTVFTGCGLVTVISLPSSISSFGAQVFQGCSSLTSLVITGSASTIGSVQNCTSLNKITLPETITTIEANQFATSKLISAVLPASVATIQTSAFSGAYACLQYAIKATTPPTLENVLAFKDINAACKIYVPDASVSAYKAATNWVTYANYIYPMSTMEGAV